MAQSPIVAFGHPVFDLIETPDTRTSSRVLSGCSTNACVAITTLGDPAMLVGRVGDDFRGRLVAELDRHEIAHVLGASDESAGFRLVYDGKENRTLFVLGRAPEIDALPPELARARAVLVGPVLGETPAHLVRRIRECAGAPVMLDPQGLLRRVVDGRVDAWRNPEIDAVLPLVDIVKASASEASLIAGIDVRHDAPATVRALHACLAARGPGAARRQRERAPVVIVTLAEQGSIVFDGSTAIEIPAYATDAIDPTGAGDVYAGAFLHRYVRDPIDLRAAGFFAAAAASIMVETLGADPPMSPAAIETRVSRMRGTS